MTQKRREEPSPGEMKRVDGFLDCVARLLARRWLRDQRHQEEGPPQKERRPRDQTQ
jgi:hypothetical protein